MTNKISNPIYSELLKLKLIKKKNIIKISNKTRDKNVKVYRDKLSKIIFLEKAFSHSVNHYNDKFSDMDRVKKNLKLLSYLKKKLTLLF